MEQVVIVFWLIVGGQFGYAGVSAIPVPYTSEAQCIQAAEKLSSRTNWNAVCVEMGASDIEIFASQFASRYNLREYK